MTSTPSQKSPTWLPTYLGLGTVWGLSFLFIAWANQSFSPVGVAFWRMMLGGAPMVVLALVTKGRWPTDWRVWLKVAGTSITMNAVPAVLFAFAELHASSSFAGIMNGATPIATLRCELRVAKALHQHDPGTCDVGGIPAGRGRLR